MFDCLHDVCFFIVPGRSASAARWVGLGGGLCASPYAGEQMTQCIEIPAYLLRHLPTVRRIGMLTVLWLQISTKHTPVKILNG